MNITDINETWGAKIEFEDPMDFFKQDKSHMRELLYEKKLLVFKKMTFTELDYAKFAYYFGKPWEQKNYAYSHERSDILTENNKKFVITSFSNIIISTKKIPSDIMPWHADIPNADIDHCFPHRALWIVKNPNASNSGHTFWLNIEDGIDYLSDELKDLSHRITVLQQSWYSPGTDEKLFDFIKVHPVTRKKSLRLNYYVRPGHSGAWIKKVYIDGVEQADCSLIQTYIDYLLQFPELYIEHVWETYDIAIYDNYSFIHGRTALQFNEEEGNERKFHRINIDHMSDENFINQNI